MKKFMLGCRFNFKADVKSLTNKAAKCSSKTTGVLLDDHAHALT